MKYKTTREEELSETKMITIIIGEDTYRITESNDGKLNINKTSNSNDDLMRIHPRTGNKIELS